MPSSWTSRLKEAFAALNKIVMWIGAAILLLLPSLFVEGQCILDLCDRSMLCTVYDRLSGLESPAGQSTGMMNLAGAAFMAFGAYTAGLFAH